MSIERQLKQLRREAARSPGKAAALGLLAVVAVWFWVPLVWGWVKPTESASKKAALAASGMAPKAAAAGSATEKPSAENKAASYTWQELESWRKQDPLTTPADTLKARRDPFRAPAVTVVEALEKEEAEKVAKAALVALKPDDLGLKVSSTIVGSARRVALINGRTYLEGQEIKCDKAGQEIVFRLVEVQSRHVILEREGQRFELVIPEKKRSDRIELSGTIK